MNRRMKIVIGLSLVLLLAFGFVVIRTFVAKPQETVKIKPIPAGEYDPAVWGKNYPLQYASYLKNRQMSPSPTGYGGSEKVQKSIMQPELLTNFKGNPFSKDYTEDRGHPYAVEDLLDTKRIGPTSPGACITCKTAHVETFFKDMGWGYAKVPLTELTAKTKHPVVCGQCHAEYYFEPGSSRVVFPWDKGLTPEAMYEYYAGKPFGFVQDWQHPDSKTPMLKAQHPEFETWSEGVHGKAGVSCADCHMPFMREEGRKYTSHWVTSPLKHIKNSCRTCHTQSEEWLLTQVKTTQDRTWQLMHIAGQTIARAHDATGRAGQNPAADPAALAKARELIRKAQWFWDIVAAENGMGAHNPGGNMNILGQSIDLAHQAIEAAAQAGGATKQ